MEKSKKVYGFNLNTEHAEFLKEYGRIAGISFSAVIDDAVTSYVTQLRSNAEMYKKIIKYTERKDDV